MILINFVEVDAKKLYEKIIVQFQTALGAVLYPGDERRIFLEQETQIIVAIFNTINEAAKMNLLRYSKEEILDAIGEEKDTPRLPAQKATCTVKFMLNQAQSNPITIPKGTRVTPDGALFFETTKEETVPIGVQEHEILTQATIAGVSYNGFSSGQIKTLVDPIPFISSVANTSISSGGADIEADDNGVDVWSGYRERIRLASAKISTAGHELGYIYHAKSADANITDVVITSPNPGEILITVLMKNGELPDETVLNKVKSACSPKHVRPQTDKVTAAAPTVSNYNINLTYYISALDSINEAIIKDEVKAAVEAYKLWQDTKIGRDINPDELRKYILNAGACRVDLVSPSFTELGETQLAKVGTVTVDYGGLK